MNLLLIHSLVRDQKTVIDSLTADTRYIIIDNFQDDLQTIKDKILVFNLSFERVGLFQENDNKPYYQLTRKFQRSALVGVESQDSNLDTWTEFIDLLNFCKNLNMTNLDMMDCNIASDKNWDYIIRYIENNLNININASSNETGNSAMSGDWILERGNVNLIGTYFTENIKEYKYTLGGAGGLSYTMILNNKNEVYGCGSNQFGQLGNNTETESNTLVPMELSGKIPVGKKVINIACGVYHTIVLLDDGTVYGCGDNTVGQLGNGNNTQQTTLVPMILTGKKVINIACGVYHTIVLLDDGTVYGCGYNFFGQLGNGDTESQQKTLVPMTLSGKKVVNIACCYYHTIVLLDDETVYGCGDNYYGQLGNDTPTDSETTLVQMKYYNNNNPINVTDASTATFATIFFNPSAITKTYDGNTNLTLIPSMYDIYTYNPLQPTITINMYTDAKIRKNRKFHKYSIFTSNIYFEEIAPYSLIIIYLSTFLVSIFNMHIFLDAFKSLSISNSHFLHLNISFPPNSLFIFPQPLHVFDVNSSVITL